MLERFSRLPSALERLARWERLGPSRIPVLLVHPDRDGGRLAPGVIWMHGRTAFKELDPGRYLRLVRAGFAVCAVDLPGHGERFEAAMQHPRHTLEVVVQMIDEIDEVADEWPATESVATDGLSIGGMSAGGMATLARLCHPHRFRCTSVEGCTGSWEHQRHREMFEGHADHSVAAIDPIRNLEDWREIPVQAIHTRADAWVDFDGQAAFVDALRDRYEQPNLVEFVTYEETGAPFEHAGFGRMAADAKNRQRDFFARWGDPSRLGRREKGRAKTGGHPRE